MSALDTRGRPGVFRGAEVDVSVRSAANGELFDSSGFRGPSIARSWGRGQFFLTGLPPSATFELLFSKDGFAPARYEIAGPRCDAGGFDY